MNAERVHLELVVTKKWDKLRKGFVGKIKRWNARKAARRLSTICLRSLVERGVPCAPQNISLG